jgi:hypothetical protein
MEVYIGPPAANPDSFLQRADVLTALANAGVTPSRTETIEPGVNARTQWILWLAPEISVRFQEEHGGLVFATLDHSMFESTGIPDRVCAALAKLGWETDEHSVG